MAIKRKRVEAKQTATTSKKSVGRSRKLLVSAGVAAGVLASAFFGLSGRRPSVEPKAFIETRYALKALPVIRRVSELVKNGSIRVAYADVPGFNARYTSETKTLTLPARPESSSSGFHLFHEGNHAVADEHAEDEPLLLFLRRQGALKDAEQGLKVEVTVSDEVAKKYAAFFQKKPLSQNASGAEVEGIKQEILSKLKEYNEKRRDLHCLTEIHSNLFDVHGLYSDDNMFFGLKRVYPNVSTNLSKAKFDEPNQSPRIYAGVVVLALIPFTEYFDVANPTTLVVGNSRGKTCSACVVLRV